MSKTIDVAMTYIEGYFSCYFALEHYILLFQFSFVIGLELHPPMVGRYHHVGAVKLHLLRF